LANERSLRKEVEEKEETGEGGRREDGYPSTTKLLNFYRPRER
jgi:hypothetical protein